MKKLLFIVVVLMSLFTGHILVNRPGTIDVPSGEILETLKQGLNSATGLLNSKPKVKAAPPYFSYLSGDVLINTESDSFLAELNISLRLKDEIFVSTNSKAVLNIGENQYIHFSEGAQAVLLTRTRMNKGFTTLKLLKGTILVDFFKSKNPVGVKIETSHASLISPDATFRVSLTQENEARFAIDRGSVMLTNHNSKKEFALSPGEGAIVTKHNQSIDAYEWVDDYPWEKAIEETLLLGRGQRPTFNAPLLSRRDEVSARRNQENTRPRRSRANVNYRKTSKMKAKTKAKVKQSNSFVKNLGSSAANALKKVPGVGGNIQESTETIQNFEKLQQQRVKSLDNLEE